jgi:hypothetical protein
MQRYLKAGLGAMLALSLALPAGAMADTSSTGDVIGSTLDLTAPGSADWAAGVTLDGQDQTATFTIPTTLNDKRGTGDGWNMTITSTRFTKAGGKMLADDASAITTVSSACAAGATCTDPTNAVGYPLTVPADETSPDAVKVFNAASDTGMGKFTVTPSVSVSVPANSYAGTYTSTLTLAATSGP